MHSGFTPPLTIHLPPYSISHRTFRPRCLSVPSRRPPRALLDESVAVVLSHHEAAALLPLAKTAAALQGASTRVAGAWSVDCGKREVGCVEVRGEGVVFVEGGCGVGDGEGVHVSFGELKKMAKKGKVGAWECFGDGVTGVEKIAGISEITGRAASLQPHVEGRPPTVALGGFGMHRFKGTDPGQDTEAKIAALKATGAVCGRALDVCTGLGYTAIALSEVPAVSHVTTIELDPVIADVVSARNPWSEALFRSEKIERVVGDATAMLPTLPARAYDVAVHDPPAQAMGGELYALAFYEELARVLVSGGRLFHYVGDPESKESGRLFRGVEQRLRDAGFERVKKARDAFGVVAVKAYSV